MSITGDKTSLPDNNGGNGWIFVVHNGASFTMTRARINIEVGGNGGAMNLWETVMVCTAVERQDCFCFPVIWWDGLGS